MSHLSLRSDRSRSDSFVSDRTGHLAVPSVVTSSRLSSRRGSVAADRTSSVSSLPHLEHSRTSLVGPRRSPTEETLRSRKSSPRYERIDTLPVIRSGEFPRQTFLTEAPTTESDLSMDEILTRQNTDGDRLPHLAGDRTSKTSGSNQTTPSSERGRRTARQIGRPRVANGKQTANQNLAKKCREAKNKTTRFPKASKKSDVQSRPVPVQSAEPNGQRVRYSAPKDDHYPICGTVSQPAADLTNGGEPSEYIRALDNLRALVSAIAKDVLELKTDFYGTADSDGVVRHLTTCSEKFIACQKMLKKNGVKMEPLDSELAIMALLNDLRSVDEPDDEMIAFVTELWETLKRTTDRCQAIRSRYDTMVYRRLKMSCRSASVDGEQVDVSKDFSTDVDKFTECIDENLYNLNSLCRGFANGLKASLFTEDSVFLDSYVTPCAVLRLVPEMTSKLNTLLDVSRAWIDADEQYVRNIGARLHENVARTCEKQAAYEETQPKYRKMLRTVKIAELMCQNQKNHLRTIEAELASLETQLTEVNLRKRQIENEVFQKESMVDFLQISISRTRHNQSLQLKRARLVKRLGDLESRLVKIGQRCVLLVDQLNEKMARRAALVESLNGHQSTYLALKDQLRAFSEKLEQLKDEILQLQEYVSHIQQIRDLKIQPETIEEFYDRPPSVKLAPSLKEKINRKRATRQSGDALPRTRRKIPVRIVERR